MEHPIFEKIQRSPQPDFGDVISKSFELYKKTFTQGLTHTLISLVVVIPFILIIYIPLIPMYIEMIQNAGDPYYTPTAFEDYSIAMIVGWVILVFLFSFLMQMVNMSIFGHFFKDLKRMDYGTNEDIGGYFTLLKTHFSKLFMLSLATLGIALLAALLCYLPIFYVMIPLHWAFPIFIFNDKLSVSDTIKAAFKFGNKNWLTFAGIGIVVSIIASLGAIACYIGMIATLFFTYIATYVTYRDTIGFEDVDGISSIGKPVEE
ncbi:hypothetical protein KXJ69_01755 [Aureisphaera sp. CAU 1614]|uniref:DUF4013 domain-containing protein n=1 Tax=Halomarinibacterium sedimenti TaxID=2857106 RepID=A0A9X1FM31_9FLAO|nr:hypothetical protein [Halomarinibacterium sedimenti]MBW2936810.1 hypothetical protein [Halomarinibacterium sedimenti]